MRIACIQTSCLPGDVASNLQRIEKLTARAAEGGARLALFPELMTTGYAAPEIVTPLAEPIPGPVSAQLTRIAVGHRMTLAVGLPESNAQGTVRHNTLLVIGADGGEWLRYRKVHLWDSERSWAQPGEGFPVRTILGLRVGANICYDVRFPEGARSLALAGAQLMLLATAWLGPVEEWELAVRSRALDNGIYVAAAAQQGGDFIGSSLIVDPHGTVIARGTPAAEEVLFAELDPDAVTRFRDRVPLLRDRQPDTYSR